MGQALGTAAVSALCVKFGAGAVAGGAATTAVGTSQQQYNLTSKFASWFGFFRSQNATTTEANNITTEETTDSPSPTSNG